MIAILSTIDDISTLDIEEWLRYLNPEVAISRWNGKTELRNFELYIKEKCVFYSRNQNFVFDSSAIENYWYRRGHLSIPTNISSADLSEMPQEFQSIYLKKILYDNSLVCEAIEAGMAGLRHINLIRDNDTNRLRNLIMASNLGLAVPATLVTDNFDSLKGFFRTHNKIISKPFHFASFGGRIEKKAFTVYGDLQLLQEADLQPKSDSEQFFISSMFQEYIEKKFEIRTLYLDGKFYSMAIFSQENEKTKLDFRNYDFENPNRCVPFNLPLIIETKLQKLMLNLGMKSGSIDLIFSPTKKFYFLEVNPIGQFQWLSRNCNYFIEEKFAKSLLNLTRP